MKQKTKALTPKHTKHTKNGLFFGIGVNMGVENMFLFRVFRG